MSDENGYEPKVWTYAGRRQGARGGLFHVWFDEDGVERAFDKLPATVIGGHYMVNVKPTGEGNVSVKRNPTWLSGNERAECAAEWELQDRAAYTADQVRKAENRAGGEDQMGQLTLSAVREKLFAARGGQRTAILAQVLRYLRV